MPLDIDPKWEYWEPDPEIAEVLHLNNVLDKEVTGFRYGNPNKCCFKLGKAKRIREILDRKICLTCGYSFFPRSCNSKYCSRRCSGRLRIVEKPCLICGELFFPHRKEYKYCSVKCNGKSKKFLVDKNCLICNKLFSPTTINRKYCSNKCSGESRSLPEVFCKCGIKFKPNRKSQILCGESCAKLFPGGGPPKKMNDGLFKELYLKGYEYKNIAEMIGMSIGHCKRMRSKLNLPGRK